MNKNYLTMLDFENVLKNVQNLLPKLQGGQVRASMHGGIDEEQKYNAYSLNNPLDDNNRLSDRHSEKQLLMQEVGGDVSIAYIAGTIEVEETIRLKKLLFRATRGKALTKFSPFDLPR